MPKSKGTQAERGIPGKARSGQRVGIVAGVGRQLEEIYLQLDTQLTRLAQIQLQVEDLRSKIKLL